jgi:hypothetical protein
MSAAHFLTSGERIAAHLSTHLPAARVQVALSLPLAALDSLRSGQDGIYVLYRGAAAPETAARGTHARIPQRWGVVVIVRWLSENADNPALWEKAGVWTQTVLHALAGWEPDGLALQLVGLPSAIAADPDNPTVAALETLWQADVWIRAPENLTLE